MGSWVHEFMASWVNGFMGSWFQRFMGSWVHGYMGSMNSGGLGIHGSWVHGFIGSWVHGLFVSFSWVYGVIGKSCMDSLYKWYMGSYKVSWVLGCLCTYTHGTISSTRVHTRVYVFLAYHKARISML
jgi:hypothetical protein